MFKNILLGGLIVWVLAMAPSAFAGKVELTTYYPAPFGEYQELNSTGETHLSTNSGNVGIGTTAPAAKLDVVGNVTVSQGANFATAAGNVGIGTAAPAAKLDVVGNAAVSQGASLATAGGRVGIGTAAPAAKLDVVGDIHATNDICTNMAGGVCLSTTAPPIPGTLCGSHDTGPTVVVARCSGFDPMTSCPSGYAVTKIAKISGNDVWSCMKT